MVTVLDDADVVARLDPRTAVMAMREALVAAYRGELEAPPRVHASVLAFTCGRMADSWYGYRSYATHLGGQQVVVIHAEPSGDLVGVAVGTALGALRTGALGGAAADALARPEANTVGLVGAGSQAWAQLWALSAVRPLTDVAVALRRPAAPRSLPAPRRTRRQPVSDAREAVRDRDVVVLATSSPTAVLDAAWLAPGTAVTTVGPKQVGRAEFGPDLPGGADVIVTDSPAQLAAYDPPALLATARAEHLGAVLSGDHPGRTSPAAITLYASVGLAGRTVPAGRLRALRSDATTTTRGRPAPPRTPGSGTAG
jgi:ornithine cyclodeaminase